MVHWIAPPQALQSNPLFKEFRAPVGPNRAKKFGKGYAVPEDAPASVLDAKSIEYEGQVWMRMWYMSRGWVAWRVKSAPSKGQSDG